MSGFNNSVVGGFGILKRKAIQSFNFVSGQTGWSLNADGTAQFNQLTIVIQASGAAVLIYYPVAGTGNLIGSWSQIEFTDQYGNDVPAGINATSGILNAVTVQGASIITSTITNAIIDGCSIANSNLTSGTTYEQTITFDSGGGVMVGYTTTTTTVTSNVAGTYTWTAPINGTAKIECSGGDGGGNGAGTNEGGPGAGGGEYACEPAYSITSGTTYQYTVGAGGNGGSTFQGGTDAGDSFFDNQGVYANGGQAFRGSFLGGNGGSGSKNTIHHNGGRGGDGVSGKTGGASGGNSASPTAAGNNGISSTGSTGAPSPAGQTGARTGCAGGSNTGNGAGNTGAGGGGGASTTFTAQTKSYAAYSTRCYYGSDATGSPNGTRTTGGTLWQNGETSGGGSWNGTMKSAFLFDRASMMSDFSGYSMDSATLWLTCNGTWYNSGATVQINAWLNSQGSSLPGSWNGSGSPNIGYNSIAAGQRKGFSLGKTAASNYANGTNKGIALGPGSAYNLAYYAYFNGTQGGSTSGPGPVLVLSGHQTGSGSTQGGDGSDGYVKITYTSTQALGFAVSAVAGGDGTNTWGAGYTGPTAAVDPVTPTQPETYKYATMSGSWSNQTNHPLVIKKNSDNTVTVTGELTTPSGVIANPFTIATIPSQYWPQFRVEDINAVLNAGTPYTAVDYICQVDMSGNIKAYGPNPTSGTTFRIFGRYPLDAPAT